MANVKISELNELTQVDDDDLLVVVDTSANETKKIRAENVGTGGGGDSTPIGTIEAYSGSTAPNGYLMCDGSAISRTTYADLFEVIGTTYGTGDGSTTFNLPNLKGRTVVMRDSSQTEFDTLGETGGSKAMQQHNHNVLVDGYSISLNNGSNSAISVSYSWEQAGSPLTTSLAGTGDSGNLQPYIVLNYVIKAFKVSSTPATSQVVNSYSESTNNVYSCDYINGVEAFSGTESGTVILTKQTSGYRLIEIICTNADGQWFSSGKLPISENMNIALLSSSFRDSGETFVMWPSTLKLTNNTLVPQTNKWLYLNANGTLGYGSGNYVNVKKVYLYK